MKLIDYQQLWQHALRVIYKVLARGCIIHGVILPDINFWKFFNGRNFTHLKKICIRQENDKHISKKQPYVVETDFALHQVVKVVGFGLYQLSVTHQCARLWEWMRKLWDIFVIQHWLDTCRRWIPANKAHLGKLLSSGCYTGLLVNFPKWVEQLLRFACWKFAKTVHYQPLEVLALSWTVESLIIAGKLCQLSWLSHNAMVPLTTLHDLEHASKTHPIISCCLIGTNPPHRACQSCCLKRTGCRLAK